MKNLLIMLLALAVAGPVNFDKTVHDFGEIGVKDGPQTCTFTLSNSSEENVTIYAVVSSCGCTDVEWTKAAIAPGNTGIVKATYSNDEGPYAFDKTLSVYTSSQKKPYVLHIKGNVVKKKNGGK